MTYHAPIQDISHTLKAIAEMVRNASQTQTPEQAVLSPFPEGGLPPGEEGGQKDGISLRWPDIERVWNL